MINNNQNFKRKTFAKGFDNHKAFDEFIQNSLDKYKFVDPKQEMYDATGIYSKYIVSNKSAIPDLVIWNKKFNKNECFLEGNIREYTSFPRIKFILKAKAPQSEGRGKPKNSNQMLVRQEKVPIATPKAEEDKKMEANISREEENIVDKEEEEEPLWGEVDIEEIKNTKISFQALPKMNNQNINTLEDLHKLAEDPEDAIINELMEEMKDMSMNKNDGGSIVNNIVTNVDKLFETSKPEEKLLDTNSLFSNDFSLMFKCEERNKSPGILASSPKEEVDCQEKRLDFDTNLKVCRNDIQINATFKEEDTNANILSSPNHPNIQDNIIYDPNIPSGYIMVPQNANQQIKIINPPMLSGGPMPLMPIPSVYMPEMFNGRQQNNVNNMMKINPAAMRINNVMPMGNFNRGNNTFNPNYQEDNRHMPGNHNSNINFNAINPTLFLENPSLIVQKNFVHKGWFLMDDNKILGNFNSLDLFNYLDSKFQEGRKLRNVSITDYETDIYFTPKNLHEILKETIPKILESIPKQPPVGMFPQKEINMHMNRPSINNMNNLNTMKPNMSGNNMYNMNIVPNMNGPNGNMIPNITQKKGSNLQEDTIPGLNNKNVNKGMPNQMSFPQQHPTPNFNINFQIFKNDINFNTFSIRNQNPNDMVKKTQKKKENTSNMFVSGYQEDNGGNYQNQRR